MNAKEFVQIVKKMFSKGLKTKKKIKLADEGPVCRLLLRQWDKFFGTSIENKKLRRRYGPTLRMYVGITNLQRKNCQAIIGVLGFWLPPLVFCSS